MIEKVNPSHPDKVADRIAGALVDLAYTKNERPKIAVEVLIGHSACHIIAETSVHLEDMEVLNIVNRIMYGTTDMEKLAIDYKEVPQDAHLSANQEQPHCGDNGIFKGVPVNEEETTLSKVVRKLYKKWPTDGKFIYDEATRTFISCQSNAKSEEVAREVACELNGLDRNIVNPLGEWTGGPDVDTGATNRKLGSDMGRAVTGGGLHGKDLSKADVSVNIVAHILAQKWGQEVSALCAIGDDKVEFNSKTWHQTMTFPIIMRYAEEYVYRIGGFEKLAEWGLF